MEIKTLLEEMVDEGYISINFSWKNEHDEYPYSLTEKGKQLALFKLYDPEYKDVDYIYSSEYLRALQTAEILSNIINKEIIKDRRFNERFRGKGKIENNYEKKQFNDINYKLKKGESQDDVSYSIDVPLCKLFATILNAS